MHRNILFLALLVLVVLCFGWFAIKASYEIYNYYSQSTQGEAEVTFVEIEKLKGSLYRLNIHYFIQLEGRREKGVGQLGRYPNHFVAQEEAMRIEKERRLPLWYNPHHPTCAVFERAFPYKSTLSALILLGLGLYLFLLGRYVGRRLGGP